MAKCPGGHIDPKQWKKSTKQGVVRWFCKHCGKFLGYDAEQAANNQVRAKK